MNKDKKDFFEIYKTLCQEYNMYIGIGHMEGEFGDAVPLLEEVTEVNELKEHFKEVEEDLN